MYVRSERCRAGADGGRERGTEPRRVPLAFAAYGRVIWVRSSDLVWCPRATVIVRV